MTWHATKNYALKDSIAAFSDCCDYVAWLTRALASKQQQQQQQHEIYFCLGKPIGIYNLNGIHK